MTHWNSNMDEAPREGTAVHLKVSTANGASRDSVAFYCNNLERWNRQTGHYEGMVCNMRYEVRSPNYGWYPVGNLPVMAMTIEPIAWMSITDALFNLTDNIVDEILSELPQPPIQGDEA